MFKKQNTYYITYYVNGNYRDIVTVYLTLKVSTVNTEAFRKGIENELKRIYFEKTKEIANDVQIKSIDFISIEVSFLGIRLI